MCIVWASECLSKDEASEIVQALDDAIHIRGTALPGDLFTAMDFMPMSRKDMKE